MHNDDDDDDDDDEVCMIGPASRGVFTESFLNDVRDDGLQHLAVGCQARIGVDLDQPNLRRTQNAHFSPTRLTKTTFHHVSAVADGPARRAASRASCSNGGGRSV